MTSYNTKQREAIRVYLTSLHGEHVTIDQVVAHFANSSQKVGRTTVYRYLEKLFQVGQVRKYKTEGQSSACFQYIEEPGICSTHFHLRCNRCGRLSHLECPALHDIEDHILEKHAFRIDPLKTVFFGVCASCQEQLDIESATEKSISSIEKGQHE